MYSVREEYINRTNQLKPRDPNNHVIKSFPIRLGLMPNKDMAVIRLSRSVPHLCIVNESEMPHTFMARSIAGMVCREMGDAIDIAMLSEDMPGQPLFEVLFGNWADDETRKAASREYALKSIKEQLRVDDLARERGEGMVLALREGLESTASQDLNQLDPGNATQQALSYCLEDMAARAKLLIDAKSSTDVEYNRLLDRGWIQGEPLHKRMLIMIGNVRFPSAEHETMLDNILRLGGSYGVHVVYIGPMPEMNFLDKFFSARVHVGPENKREPEHLMKLFGPCKYTDNDHMLGYLRGGGGDREIHQFAFCLR